jgi:hypothetical protein
MKAFRIWVGILKDLAEMVLRWIPWLLVGASVALPSSSIILLQQCIAPKASVSRDRQTGTLCDATQSYAGRSRETGVGSRG